MKPLHVLCAIGLTACVTATKPVPRSERPSSRVAFAEVDDRRVSFTAGGDWEPLPQGGSEVLILQYADSRDSAIAVFFEKAEPGSTVEETTTRWMKFMLSGPMVFTVTGASAPLYLSDEEATFTIGGFDKKTPMVSKCRIKLIGDATSDYWAVIFSVSPTTLQEKAFAEVDGIARSLRLEPSIAP